jgi:hypothetical protein
MPESIRPLISSDASPYAIAPPATGGSKIGLGSEMLRCMVHVGIRSNSDVVREACNA